MSVQHVPVAQRPIELGYSTDAASAGGWTWLVRFAAWLTLLQNVLLLTTFAAALLPGVHLSAAFGVSQFSIAVASAVNSAVILVGAILVLKQKALGRNLLVIAMTIAIALLVMATVLFNVRAGVPGDTLFAVGWFANGIYRFFSDIAFPLVLIGLLTRPSVKRLFQ